MNEIVIPENLNVAGARLPAAYEAVKVALANCVRIDECKEWANRAEALASYAKQADDDTLLKAGDPHSCARGAPLRRIAQRV